MQTLSCAVLDTPFQENPELLDAAFTRAMQHTEPPVIKAKNIKPKVIRDRTEAFATAQRAFQYRLNRKIGEPLPHTVEGLTAHIKTLHTLQSQYAALFNAAGCYNPSPKAEIAALSAICELPDAWRLVRVTKAARHVEGNVYEVPSESNPGDFRRVELNDVLSSGSCGCPATGECFHIENALHVARLYRQQHEELLQIENLTSAAFDAAEGDVL